MTAADVFSVADHRIVIVGGTTGIGWAVAVHLAEAGASVTIAGRRDSSQEAAGAGMTFVQMDVGDAASVAHGFEVVTAHTPRIDCLVLNAGIDLDHGEIGDLDLATFERVFDINTLGLVRAMSCGVGAMSAGGSVIVTSSPAGSITTPGMAAYSASKAALDMLVRTWALELGPRQIRVNAVLPGIVESEMDAASTGAVEIIRRMTANGVFRTATEMGPVFQFLASRASAPMTGSLVGAHDGISVGYSAEVMQHLSAERPEQTSGATGPADESRPGAA